MENVKYYEFDEELNRDEFISRLFDANFDLAVNSFQEDILSKGDHAENYPSDFKSYVIDYIWDSLFESNDYADYRIEGNTDASFRDNLIRNLSELYDRLVDDNRYTYGDQASEQEDWLEKMKTDTDFRESELVEFVNNCL